MKIPNENLARDTLARWAGRPVTRIARFATGSHHYVYDAVLEGGQPIVIRMTAAGERAAMTGALSCNRQLRVLGLPLPEIHFSDLACETPYLIMQRLPGTDSGFVLETMTIAQQQALAAQLMGFQRQVGTLSSAGRYGFSASPDAAPYGTWTEVLTASLNRSRTRILAVGAIYVACIDPVERLLEQSTRQLADISATPFLHDITTKNVIVYEGGLSGIVDIDDFCFGDPLFHIGLTRMAVLSRGGDTRYIDFLLDAFGPYSAKLLRLYTAIFCIDFLSELGQAFNGNNIDGSDQRKAHLLAILDQLLKG